jgi:hypothetical protein
MSTLTAQQKEQMKRMSERNANTQPTSIEDFNVNNLVFDEPLFGQIPNQPIKYHTVNIGYRNPDKTVGELVFELRDYSSFGITENRDAKTEELQGYSVGISFGEYNQRVLIISSALSLIILWIWFGVSGVSLFLTKSSGNS